MKNQRIEVIDALRGFAIVCIILLHNMEHFEFVYTPTCLPTWLLQWDEKLSYIMYFLFGGKAYAIFAFIFGFSFFIQFDNQQKQGKDFRFRFAIRLFWLLIFGFINTAFYQGDILVMYSFLGLLLIPVCNFSNKNLLIVALIFMAQPWEWAHFIYTICKPNYTPAPSICMPYYEQIKVYMQNGNFFDYVWGDVTLGKAASLLWSWEAGRFFQAPALFMLGTLAGRKQLFNFTETNILFWKKVFKIAAIAFIPLTILTLYLPEIIVREAITARLMVIFSSWANFALMLVWTAGFILLFHQLKYQKTLAKLIPLGKMGLTNYIMQSAIGAVLYYKYGFGLYQYTGVTISILIGCVLLYAQIAFCNWWLKTHKQGPLEQLWHKLTWMKF